jgi:hypothetical protein
MQRDVSTSQVLTYLQTRVAAGHAVPGVEVVSLQPEQRAPRCTTRQAAASSKKEAAGEAQEGEAQGDEAEDEGTRHAVLEYVVKGLNEELFTELLEGFHFKV